MVTEKIYQTQPDVLEFEAYLKKVITGNRVLLDRTAFYPESGGQPCDLGTMEIDGENYDVVDVRKLGIDILHTLNRQLLDEPKKVFGRIDAHRRNLHTRMHTALHILNGIVFNKFNGALVTGGQINSDGTGRLDFTGLHDTLSEQLKELEHDINRIVEEDREVRIFSIPQKKAVAIPGLKRTANRDIPVEGGQIRVVEIVGLDSQACGGTHTPSTGYAGPIHILKIKSKGKDNRRIKIALDDNGGPKK